MAATTTTTTTMVMESYKLIPTECSIYIGIVGWMSCQWKSIPAIILSLLLPVDGGERAALFRTPIVELPPRFPLPHILHLQQKRIVRASKKTMTNSMTTHNSIIAICACESKSSQASCMTTTLAFPADSNS